MKNIAIFASGSGSNAEKIMEFFSESKSICVSLIVSENKNAGVLLRAANFGIKTLVINKSELLMPINLIEALKRNEVSLIVLAGFLQKIPKAMILEFPYQIINIHPSLLPKYGGKGMYGHNVHKAVKDNKDSVSGPTIHLVNEEYDKGQILFQKEIKIDPRDSVEQIASKVLSIEHEEYPRVIEKYINDGHNRS